MISPDWVELRQYLPWYPCIGIWLHPSSPFTYGYIVLPAIVLLDKENFV